MNRLEKTMVDLLVELRERYHVVGVKAEFEAEGTRLEEVMRLKEVSMQAGLGLTLKIGGCEARTDMFAAGRLGVQQLVAPMVETPYALKKYLHAITTTFSPEDRQDVRILINLETITACEHFDQMLELPEIDQLDGVVIGRADLTGSLGMGRDEANGARILAIATQVAAKAKARGLSVGIGGAVSPPSIPFFQAFPPGHLDRYETRKVVFGCPGALHNPEEAFLLAFEFELLWLTNKKNHYGAIHREDDARLALMEAQYRQTAEAIARDKASLPA